MRLTIRKHNQPFLSRIAAQMECQPVEALNYLLTELNRVNYSFNSAVSLNIQSFKAPLSSQIVEEIEQPYRVVESTFNCAVDPDISRLIAIGLEEF